MRFLIGFVSFFIGISTLIDAAQECYSCDRNGCNDNFNANNPGVAIVTAPDGWCLKVSGKIQGENGLTTRGVASSDICVSNDCDRVKYQNNDFQFCCCNKDRCNDASTVKIGPLIFFFVFALIFILRN